MDFDFVMLEAEETMQTAVDSYQGNISKISTGRANPKILDTINIDYYGAKTPVHQLANISVPEPRQLLIKPFDQSTVSLIVGSINSSSLGVNASDEGDKIRINFPELTTQRRKDLVKMLADYTENARVQIRNARQSANKQIKGDDSISEDLQKDYLDEIQKLTDKYINSVAEVTKEKEKDLMTM